MATSYIAGVLDSLADGLAALNALQDVKVFSGPVLLEEAGTECIAFGDFRLNEEMAALGNTKEEVWDVDGEMYVVKTWEGDTEATIRSARERTMELFAEVETYINDTYTGTYPDVEITAGEVQQNIVAEGRACRMTFSLTVTALKNP